jgi:hypothetical protein
MNRIARTSFAKKSVDRIARLLGISRDVAATPADRASPGAVLDDLPILNPRNGDRHADMDINDKCNLSCPTCFRGVGSQKNTSALMPLEKFREVANKLTAEGYPNISLINWTEPFLCKTLDRYVAVVKECGPDCWLSSNLSLPPKQYADVMVGALAAGVDILFVSVSGFTQETYEINHVGGRIDWVKENLAMLARERRARRFTTSIWMRYLEWPYNAHEARLWRDVCQEFNVGFAEIPAFGDPQTPLPDANAFRKEVDFRMLHPEMAHRFDPLNPNAVPNISNEANIAISSRESAPATMASPARQLPESLCPLILDRVAIDAKGDAYLCCAYPNEPRLKIGQYTELSEADLFLRRMDHEFCKTCSFPPRPVTDTDRKRFAAVMERDKITV